jgi:hypothetical protein
LDDQGRTNRRSGLPHCDPECLSVHHGGLQRSFRRSDSKIELGARTCATLLDLEDVDGVCTMSVCNSTTSAPHRGDSLWSKGRTCRCVARIADSLQPVRDPNVVALGGDAGLPEISRFRGISIGMYHSEHAPPHFHARHGTFTVSIDLETGIARGWFPRWALREIEEWRKLRIEELRINWARAQRREPLLRITPLN